MVVSTRGSVKSIIDHIIDICGFPDDSIMTEYIREQGWRELSDVVMITLDEVADFKLVTDDGSYKAKPLNHHLRKFKGFLLMYNRMSRDLSTPLGKDDVLNISKEQFDVYCRSQDYHMDLQTGLATPTKANVPTTASNELTASEFRRGVKRDKSHYTDLKDDKYFNSWNRGFVATAFMHHTHHVLDEKYVPKTSNEILLFSEMQTFMYAVFEEHLKTDTGKSLVSQYETTRDAQSIYRELKKHAKSSTAAQLSGDTLLKYITSARYPGNWKGTSYAFVLHWKEQVAHYEKLELEAIPPKQKLRMLQNSVGDVPDLANVKQLSDQIVARGENQLGVEGYLELLLSACSTYDKKHASTRPPGQRNVYNVNTEMDDDGFYDANSNNDVFHVDTDVTDILAHSSNVRSQSSLTSRGSSMSSFIPKTEWMNMSPEQREEILAKRRKERGLQNNTQLSRHVNAHDTQEVVNLDDIIEYMINTHVLSTETDVAEAATTATSDTLLAHMAGRSSTGTSPGDIRKVLASKQGPTNKNKTIKSNETALTAPETLTVDDTTYYLNKGETVSFKGCHYSAHSSMIQYCVGQHEYSALDKALVDRGANGGICGDDMLVLEGSERFVDVSGLAGHRENQLRIVTAQALIQTHKGNVIAVFHQMALLGKGKSILSCVQMEHYGAAIDDKSLCLGGKQRIIMDGYQIPLDFQNGLPYLPCRPPTKEEVHTLPHVIMTSDVDWDPSTYDNTIDNMDQFYDAEEDEVHNSPFDAQGQYRHRTIATHTVLGEMEYSDAYEYPDYHDMIDDIIDYHHPEVVKDVYDVNTVESKPSKRDYELLRPFFAWAPSETIRRTIGVTTQYARGRVSDTIRQHWKSRFPACNVHRRNEAVATDTVFSDTPAVDSGVKAAQIFIGRTSLVADVYGIKTDKEFVNTLEDNIRERGAMDKLISDCARAETSTRIKDILRALVIADWQSEPYQENQNFAENRYGTIKTAANRVLNKSGAPPECWLLALMYVCYVLNHMASSTLGWIPPLQKLTGQTQDTSALFICSFYEPVYYDPHYDGFPSAKNEELGHWVGIATHVGDALTFKILTPNNKVIYRSVIRSALDPTTRHKRLAPVGGESTLNHVGDKVFIRSNFDTSQVDDPTITRRMPTIDPENLIGRTFLKETEKDGQRFRARIVRAIIDKDNEVKKDPQYIKFLCEIDGDTADEIISYNQILDYIERDNLDVENDTEQLYRFRRISAHQGPLRTSDKDYKGSTYNVLVEWESGEVTYEPLDMIAKDDPVTCTEYAIRNGLLDTPGWKRFKSIAKKEKTIKRMVNQAKLRSYRREPFWKFGFLVPRTHAQAVEIDQRNGNTKWQDAEATEMRQLLEYQTFIDKGKGGTAPEGYKKIRCHMVYDVKHDGRHKCRLVAGGHLTDPSSDSVYSGVVSLRGIRLVTFLAELNHLELWGADVGNAYLEAKTKEKVYIIGGPEFGELEGHTLVIYKALYGLRTSGLCWHQRFADVLRSMGFLPCKAENDIWMREVNGLYEYIAVYVDDIMIAASEPAKIIQTLESQHGFKLKGVGPLTYHLGCDYFRDDNGTLCFGPRKYIDKLIEQFERMFGMKPKEYTSPLDKGDHPEVDTSNELDLDGIKLYQSMIGCLQWAISLGRFDIHTATMTMSRFRMAPRKGHLERLKRIYGYLKKFKSAAIRVRTEEPDFSDLPAQKFDWCETVYGNVKEEIPTDIPTPLGLPVSIVTYVDANLYHDILTGRSVTGILHFCNQTLVDWYSKRQACVQTATFGSEFVAARIATDQIMDFRNTLRYLGVPIRECSYMFGDNQAVVNNSIIPHSCLSKRHNALSYHRVRETIAAGVLNFFWIDGKNNPADIVSKHWSYPQVWHLLQPILFFSGDTGSLLTGEEKEKKNED
jgi:Reverse transcriptase (RNA-dependent DNA polymerase)